MRDLAQAKNVLVVVDQKHLHKPLDQGLGLLLSPSYLEIILGSRGALRKEGKGMGWDGMRWESPPRCCGKKKS